MTLLVYLPKKTPSNMRNTIILAAAGILFGSCNMNEEELALLNAQKDSLTTVAFQKDQTINEFLGSFAEIQTSLSEITEKENAIANASSNPEMIQSSRDAITAQITDLRTIIDESQVKIQNLSTKLRKSNIKLRKFEKMVASLNEQLASKEKDIIALNTQIATLNANVDTLNVMVTQLTVHSESQQDIIDTQTEQMQTAWVTVGSTKELTEKNVVVRQGGLLGIGKTAHLDSDVTTESFHQVDITETKLVPVDNAKAVKLVTPHPTDSYSLEKEDEKVTGVVITDPAKFWSGSKYLVVMTN